MPTAINDGIRKVALLMAALEQGEAETLLAQMGPNRAQQVREALARLGPIDRDEQQQVIEEFMQRRRPAPVKEPAGVELDISLARRLAGLEPSRRGEPSPAPVARRFSFLQETESDKLARVLAGERPQTIALVLSHLSPSQSGEVLVRLPPALQVEVARRLVDLEETDPEILAEVEHALETRFARHLQMQRRRVAGMDALANILQASDDRVGSALLDTLGAYDPRLAERLTPPPLDFDELWRIEPAALAAIIRAADRELLQLALIGSAPEIVLKFLRLLPASEAQRLRDELENPGPLRLSDVEAARAELGEIARRLAAQGRVRLPQRMAHNAAA